MGNNQLVGEYVSEKQLQQDFLNLFKSKLTSIDIKIFDNYKYLEYLFRVGLSEDMFVSYKKNYPSYSCNSYLRRLEITKLILVRTLYFWYSNMKYTKKQITYLKKIDRHFNDMNWSYRVWEGDWGELIDLDEGIYKNLLNIECKKIVIKLFYNWYSNSIL